MTEKEIAEIRRRFRPDKNSITHVHGCCVNEKREIVSEFHQPLSIMPQEEAEKILAILRKTLSGAPEKNLLDITFTTSQVAAGEEHKLLMTLRNSKLADEEAVHTFLGKIASSLNMEGNYLILLTHDTYDIPFHTQGGEQQEEASSEVFAYILCSICPVKTAKPALGYYLPENEFHTSQTDRLVAPPELGFLFPAFDDRSANLYNALYYSHSITENHPELVDAIFKSEIPMPAAVQKETFQTILGETLAEDCSYEIVQAVHEELCGLIEEHKESREEEPLEISKNTVKRLLSSCGVDDSHIAAFEEQYDAAFGAETSLSPKNIVDTKQFEIHTPDVTIRVNPERSDLLETRVINGAKYILIRADENVEVNGVNIHIFPDAAE